jgi:RNA-binding protein
MNELSSKERRALRARAHKLDAVVIVGGTGLSEAVVAEIERALAAHELIKIRVPEADRDEREAMMQSIASRLGAAPVQHIGKVLVVHRPRPEAPKPAYAAKPARPAGRAGKPRAKARAVFPRPGERPDQRDGRARTGAPGRRAPRPSTKAAKKEAAKPGTRAGARTYR